MFLLCDSHKICWIYCFRCEQACNLRQIYDKVEHNAQHLANKLIPTQLYRNNIAENNSITCMSMIY